MSYEDFQKYSQGDKVKLVTYKEGHVSFGYGKYRDIVVDLKEIPGEKRLHRIKWIMRLGVNQVKDLLETYKGPHNEIERRQGIFRESKDQIYNAATQERGTTLKQLLIELDGFDTCKGVIFLGATNPMDLLDPALFRPGRFERKIRIRPPNSKGRLEILQVHARKVKFSDTVDMSTYANNLPGAKLAQLLQEAALVAVRKGRAAILQSDMDNAVDCLTVGPKRVGIELSQQGQCRRATSEVGTVLTSHLLRRVENPKVECCDRVSIHPRGQTLYQVVFHRLDGEFYMFESADLNYYTVFRCYLEAERPKRLFLGGILRKHQSLILPTHLGLPVRSLQYAIWRTRQSCMENLLRGERRLNLLAPDSTLRVPFMMIMI